jgi:hypothetical protein
MIAASAGICTDEIFTLFVFQCKRDGASRPASPAMADAAFSELSVGRG